MKEHPAALEGREGREGEGSEEKEKRKGSKGRRAHAPLHAPEPPPRFSSYPAHPRPSNRALRPLTQKRREGGASAKKRRGGLGEGEEKLGVRG